MPITSLIARMILSEKLNLSGPCSSAGNRRPYPGSWREARGQRKTQAAAANFQLEALRNSSTAQFVVEPIRRRFSAKAMSFADENEGQPRQKPLLLQQNG
jgi:hypothetical protein